MSIDSILIKEVDRKSSIVGLEVVLVAATEISCTSA